MNIKQIKTKKPRKLALWATAFKAQHDRLTQPAQQARQERLDGAKARRHSKNQQRPSRGQQTVIQKYRSNRIGKTAKKAKADRAYNARVKVWLTEQMNQDCMCCWMRKIPVRQATQCHHKHGRGWHGELLMVESLWIPCCSTCHPGWIHGHPDEARALGLLAPKGQWNTLPK